MFLMPIKKGLKAYYDTLSRFKNTAILFPYFEDVLTLQDNKQFARPREKSLQDTNF